MDKDLVDFDYSEMESEMDRPNAMTWLDTWRDKQIVKVVTGIRRCGKSTVLALYRDRLLAQGIPSDRIAFIDFEDPDTPEYSSWKEVWGVLRPIVSGGQRCYVFLDEVQRVPDYEKLVDGLAARKNVDVYITGSNAYFLSGELATFLTGRYVECDLHPLSLSEYRCGVEGAPTSMPELWYDYLRIGGFPFAAGFRASPRQAYEYLSGVLATILFKDVVVRKKIKETALLQRLVRFLFSNIGSFVSVQRIVGSFKSDGLSTSAATIDSFLSALCETYLFRKVDRYDIRGRGYLKTNAKYYAADTGMRYALLGAKDAELGHLLENVVYLELLRRFGEVYVGQLGSREVDFVTFDNGIPSYWQIALSVRDPDVLGRELAPFSSIRDHYRKTILTLDLDPVADYDGILVKPVLPFLLNEE